MPSSQFIRMMWQKLSVSITVDLLGVVGVLHQGKEERDNKMIAEEQHKWTKETLSTVSVSHMHEI